MFAGQFTFYACLILFLNIFTAHGRYGDNINTINPCKNEVLFKITIKHYDNDCCNEFSK